MSFAQHTLLLTAYGSCAILAQLDSYLTYISIYTPAWALRT